MIGAASVLVWSIQRPGGDEAYATDATVVVFRSAGLSPASAERDAREADDAMARPVDRLFEPTDTALPDVRSVVPELPAPDPAPVSMPEGLDRLDTARIERDAEFFGTGASDAKRVVYVVDASGSSIAIFPAVARELERSLLSLNATQHATVIAALGRPARGDEEAEAVVMMATDRLVRTTTKRARELALWFRERVQPAGRSDLLLALREALALRPDAVFLLATPGNASAERDGFAASLDGLNPVDARTGRRRAIIGVVSVGPPPVGDPLLEIARVHGGGAPLVVLERDTLLGEE
ncbi:MAG: hypothetical protein Tsb0013_22310 [Phycisphaerales bacterium]